MHRFLLVFGVVLLQVMAALASGVTNTAQVRMFCLSVRVKPGVAEQFGLQYRLTLSSGDFNPANDELFPVLEETVSHASGFLFEAPEFPEPLIGVLVMQVPETLDELTNGIPDFYEVSAEIPGISNEGFWQADNGPAEGSLTATWQRAAGQREGTVRIQLTSDEFRVLPEFTHSFEIIEYAGPFEYSPSEGEITGVVRLKRVGLETETLTGPLILTREPTNRLNEFTIGESNLTNHLGQVVPASIGDVERDPDYEMDYFGAFSLLNGDPSTPEVDYELFYMGFDDPNDSDNDGIPDLTDDTGAPPIPPRLSLALDGEAGVRFTISGQTGFVYSVERASGLDPELWFRDRTITLTETNQTVLLSVPAGVTAFWRLRWP